MLFYFWIAQSTLLLSVLPTYSCVTNYANIGFSVLTFLAQASFSDLVESRSAVFSRIGWNFVFLLR